MISPLSEIESLSVPAGWTRWQFDRGNLYLRLLRIGSESPRGARRTRIARIVDAIRRSNPFVSQL